MASIIFITTFVLAIKFGRKSKSGSPGISFEKATVVPSQSADEQQVSTGNNFCIACGAALTQGARFCQDCGKEVASSPNAELQPATPQIVLGEMADDKTLINVILTGVGTNKINVIKAITEITSLGLKESVALVDSAPAIIKKKVTGDEAATLKQRLEEAGATVAVISSSQAEMQSTLKQADPQLHPSLTVGTYRPSSQNKRTAQNQMNPVVGNLIGIGGLILAALIIVPMVDSFFVSIPLFNPPSRTVAVTNLLTMEKKSRFLQRSFRRLSIVTPTDTVTRRMFSTAPT